MEASLAHMNVALWIIAILGIFLTAVLIVTLSFVIKLLVKLMNTIDETKEYVKKLSDKLDPLADSAMETLTELKSATAKIHGMVTKIADTTSSLGSFLGYFNIFNGLMPTSKGKKGFLAGLTSGLSLFGKLKQFRNKSKKSD